MKPVSPSFRFGAFEFYPHSGELLRQGRRLRMQNQIAQTLAFLVWKDLVGRIGLFAAS